MFISLDLETTGFDPKDDEIIEFGAIKFDLQGNTETLQFLCNPHRPIPQIVSHITKIYDKDLKGQASFEEKKQEVIEFIGDLPIVGHNIQFDTNFLRAKGLDLNNPEYDTHEFAGIVLPDMPSYSLEILAQELGITHVDQHRALDDAIAAMHLFLRLTEEFQRFPQNLIEEMQLLSQKSDWDLKNFLQSLKHSEKKTTESKKQEIEVSEKTKEISKIILANDSSGLFEVSKPYDQLTIELSKNAQADCYLAIPTDLFHQLHTFIPENVAIVDNTRNYISLKRLAEFKQQEHFENHEIVALLKYLSWSNHTKSGLLDELRLVNKEFKTRAKVNIDESVENPSEEYFYKKSREQDQINPSICTHQFLIENPPKGHQAIILDLEKFLVTLHNNRNTYIKLEEMESILENLKPNSPALIEKLNNKITILFGIIGMIFKKTNDQSVYTPRSSISESSLNSTDWQKAKDSVKNLIELSQEFGEIKNQKILGYLQLWKKQLQNLHEIFFETNFENSLVWIEKNYLDEIVLRQMAKNTHQILNKLLENFSNYQILGENIDLQDQGQFTKNLAGLPQNLPLKNLSQKPTNLEIEILKNSNPNDEHQIPKILIEIFRKKPGRSAVILNSKQQLNFFTVQLSQAGINVVSQLVSSTGKLAAKYKAESEEAILLVTPQIWNKIDCQDLVDEAYITKLPFDPPSAAHIVALSQNYNDPFNELQIPRAVINLKKTLKKLCQDQKPKRAVILDSRILSKSYGKQFLNALENIAPISGVTLDELSKN